jgi:tetratricopeptide (TPR) repeat protein
MGAALTGRIDQARELIADAPPGYVRERIRAEIASHPAFHAAGDISVTDAWMSAYHAATSDEEKIYALRGLAIEGGTDHAAMDELRTRHPEAVADIEIQARVMSVDGPTADVQLRAIEARTPLASVRRAELLRVNDPQRAAEVLADASARWSDSRLLLLAIDCYVDAGDWPRASTLADQAITDAGVLWPGRTTVLQRIVQIETALMNWPKVATACRALLEIDSHDDDARWSLALAEFRHGEPQDAWRTLNRPGMVENVSTPHRAIFLLELVRRFASAVDVARTALVMLRSFPEDHDVHAAAINTVSLRTDRAELPIDLNTEVSAAWSEFFTKYPDSLVLTKFNIRDDGDPLAELEPDLRQQSATYQSALNEIQKNSLPIGVLERVVRKPYSAIFPFRPLGYHPAAFSGDQDIAIELEIARAALTEACFIDASALYTLTLIAEHAALLLSLARRPTISDGALRDLLAAEDLFGFPSVGTLTFDSASDKAVAVESNPEIAHHQHQQILTMLATARGFRRVTHPALIHLPTLTTEHEPVWLLTLDAAKHHNSAVWADDIGLRGLAHRLGIKTFGTQSVLRLAGEQNLLDTPQQRQVTRTLIHEHVVDLPLDPPALLHVAAEQQWEPRAVATVLSRPAAWINGEAASNLFQTALQKSPNDTAAVWAHAALQGLRDATTPGHRNNNLSKLIAAVLVDRRTRPHHANAVISALEIVEPTDAQSITLAALDRTWTVIQSTYSTTDAATVFLYVIGQLSEPYRQHAVHRILEQGDQT